MPIATSCHLISDVYIPMTSRQFGETNYCYNKTNGIDSVKGCGTRRVLEEAVRVYGLTGIGCQTYRDHTVCLCNYDRCN